MSGAVTAALRELTISGSSVIKHEEVALVPVSVISTDKSCLDLLVIVLDGHKEDAFIAYDMASFVN